MKTINLSGLQWHVESPSRYWFKGLAGKGTVITLTFTGSRWHLMSFDNCGPIDICYKTRDQAALEFANAMAGVQRKVQR